MNRSTQILLRLTETDVKMARPSINLLSRDEIEDIHNASLEILEDPGLEILSEGALDIVKEAGGTVNYATKRATIPRNVVKEALGRAPKRLTFGARNAEHSFLLDRRETHFTTNGYAVFIRDHETGERRYSTQEDLARWATLADYLDTIHVIWPSLNPTDVPEHMQRLSAVFTCLSNSEKHVEHFAESAREAQFEIEIAAAIAGSKEELKKKPIISAVQCPIAPLRFDQGLTDAVIEFAKAGIPVVSLSMPLTGLTGPVTLAGSLVVNNAEVLGNLVISEFAAQGAPLIYAGSPGSIDFKTGNYIEAPENILLNAALTDLARYYNLPCEISGGSSSSKIPDGQAAYDGAIGLLTTILTRPDLLCGLGGIESASTMSPEMLIIGNEIVHEALRIAGGIQVSDSTLAVDVIRKVGPGGTFLAEKHTLANLLKEHLVPEISNRETYDTWKRNGSKSILDASREKTKEILEKHKPKPLEKDVQIKIEEIMKRGQTELA
ncbi:MAG TPA: trimethylamine methyltransferase family protein [archaeon]|nr:trimethylamine methyltransferase family protein [archaeon]